MFPFFATLATINYCHLTWGNRGLFRLLVSLQRSGIQLYCVSVFIFWYYMFHKCVIQCLFHFQILLLFFSFAIGFGIPDAKQLLHDILELPIIALCAFIAAIHFNAVKEKTFSLKNFNIYSSKSLDGYSINQWSPNSILGNPNVKRSLSEEILANLSTHPCFTGLE